METRSITQVPSSNEVVLVTCLQTVAVHNNQLMTSADMLKGG